MNALLEARSLSKSFGSNRVLSDVSLTIGSGEIVALIGENGAGKSTLSKILAGIITPDAGSLLLDGTEIALSHPREAIEAGIGIVHQELCLAENLTIAENITLGREQTRWGCVDKRHAAQVARSALERLGVDLAPSRLVSSLSVAERQLVEIARVLSYDARLLIFDEPTSSLSDSEARSLLTLIKKLKSSGISIVYVSHRLPEVQEIAERVIALRDGSNSGEMAGPHLERTKLIQMIVGRDLKDIYGYSARAVGPVALQLSHFRASPQHAPCSFSVHAGEIVGIAGLIGSGRSELLEAIFGVRPSLSGEIVVAGAPITITTPVEASQSGIALVPESRKDQGIIPETSIADNINISSLTSESAFTTRNFALERDTTELMISSLNVRCSGPYQQIQRLSGGNQQKVVIGRCLATNPRILLLDEPTRGVDVGARREIYSLLFRLAQDGLAILFVSSELEEIIGISDRVLVMSEGAVRGELPRRDLSEHAIMALASPHSRIAA